MEFAKKLKLLVDSHPLSQNKIGDAVGINGSFLSKLARGKSSPSLEQVQALAEFFQVPVGWLADDKADRPGEQGGPIIDPWILGTIQVLGEEEAKKRLLAAPSLTASTKPPGPIIDPETGYARLPGKIVAATRIDPEANEALNRPGKKPGPA